MLDTGTVRGQGAVVPLRRNHGFLLLMGGSSISMLGSRVTTIAYPLLVLAISGSPVMAAGPVRGHGSERPVLPAGGRDRRPVQPPVAMLVFETLRGLVIASVVATLVMHELTVPQLIVAAGVEEIFEVFSSLAERRLTSTGRSG